MVNKGCRVRSEFRFETGPSKARAFWLVLGAGIFVAISIWMIVDLGRFESGRRSSSIPFFAWAGLFFFGLCGVFAARQFFASSAQIRFDSNGVYAKWLSSDIIPWHAIEAVDMVAFAMGRNSQNYILLKMHAGSEVNISFTRLFKATRKANAFLGMKEPFFLASQMKHTSVDIYDALETAMAFYKND